jgi:hypothetical protein
MLQPGVSASAQHCVSAYTQPGVPAYTQPGVPAYTQPGVSAYATAWCFSISYSLVFHHLKNLTKNKFQNRK